MRVEIHHSTKYHYRNPVLYSIQQVRLTPRADSSQHVVNWNVQAPTKHTAKPDHFDNTVNTFTLNRSHSELAIVATGVVDLLDLDHGYIKHWETQVNPFVFASSTELTQATDEMVQFSSVVSRMEMPFERRILTLAHAVADKVQYTKGSTTVADSAQVAFENGKGVCQDHAHVMLACLRAHGIPARYVSGYRYSDSAPEFASHAWVDVYNLDKHAWLSVDATHRSLAGENHCRLAVARDYSGAAPVRGIRSGGGKEQLEVDVQLRRLS
ncbi:MAG: transglutaminase family protein [Limnobacter sp.]|nr:transglutaminase family protein [Limnobacter sp.]